MNRVKIRLTEEKATLLITLYAKALDYRSPASVLDDRLADEVVNRIDYDFDAFRLGNDQAVGIALRARMLDDWVRAFLAAHPASTVLNLACGLDSRVYRVDPAPNVPWFDVDYPEVIQLRRELLPARKGCRLIGTSVTEPHWLDDLPTDRPAIVVAEGLSPYLVESDGVELLRRLTRRLPSGEIILDVYNSLGLRLIQSSSLVKTTGAKLHWAIEDPKDLEGLVPGLRLDAVASTYDASQAARYSWTMRVLLVLWNLLPPLRRLGQLVRYRF